MRRKLQSAILAVALIFGTTATMTVGHSLVAPTAADASVLGKIGGAVKSAAKGVGKGIKAGAKGVGKAGKAVGKTAGRVGKHVGTTVGRGAASVGKKVYNYSSIKPVVKGVRAVGRRI